MKKIPIYYLLIFGFIATISSGQAMVEKKYTYQTLSAYQKQLFDEFLEDEIPEGANVKSVLTDFTSLRNKTG
ncbi:MAG: hypothetical protein R2822_18405 [Spirosomataceae bacterium]